MKSSLTVTRERIYFVERLPICDLVTMRCFLGTKIDGGVGEESRCEGCSDMDEECGDIVGK